LVEKRRGRGKGCEIEWNRNTAPRLAECQPVKKCTIIAVATSLTAERRAAGHKIPVARAVKTVKWASMFIF